MSEKRWPRNAEAPISEKLSLSNLILSSSFPLKRCEVSRARLGGCQRECAELSHPPWGVKAGPILFLREHRNGLGHPGDGGVQRWDGLWTSGPANHPGALERGGVDAIPGLAGCGSQQVRRGSTGRDEAREGFEI